MNNKRLTAIFLAATIIVTSVGYTLVRKSKQTGYISSTSSISMEDSNPKEEDDIELYYEDNNETTISTNRTTKSDFRKNTTSLRNSIQKRVKEISQKNNYSKLTEDSLNEMFDYLIENYDLYENVNLHSNFPSLE